MKTDLVQYIHTRKWYSHFGIGRTLAILRQKYCIKNVREIVETVINSCELCQRNKKVQKEFHGRRGSLFKTGPWDTLGMDIFGPLALFSSSSFFVIIIIIIIVIIIIQGNVKRRVGGQYCFSWYPNGRSDVCSGYRR